MIAVVRISGRVGLSKSVKETLERLRLKRKLNCILIDEKDKVRMGMVEKVRREVCFGPVEDSLVKKMEDRKDNEIYRLHPPRGGFKKSTKVFYPDGILGKNKEIAKLIERML